MTGNYDMKNDFYNANKLFKQFILFETNILNVTHIEHLYLKKYFIDMILIF